MHQTESLSVSAHLHHPPGATWVELDLGAIAHNVHSLQAHTGPNVRLMAVVKANGYGHGAVPVARAALSAGATHLAVATFSEAMALREAGLAAPILILGFTPSWLAEQAAAHAITLAVFDAGVAREYAEAGLSAGKRLAVHLKIDTGMSRLGVPPDQATALAAQLAAAPGLYYEGVFTHFSKADETDQAFTSEQLARFQKALEALDAQGLRPALVHAANSAAAILRPDTHFDLVRVGIALYGLDPSPEVGCPPGFQPALSFKTVISHVRPLPAGTPVGYGGTYVTREGAIIATIPVGYADGFRRAPERWPYVLVHGQRCPLAGRVCMDQSMIDVSHLAGGEPVRAGDEVVLIGRQGQARLSAEEVARSQGTNNYEVVCAISARVPRLASP